MDVLSSLSLLGAFLSVPLLLKINQIPIFVFVDADRSALEYHCMCGYDAVFSVAIPIGYAAANFVHPQGSKGCHTCTCNTYDTRTCEAAIPAIG